MRVLQRYEQVSLPEAFAVQLVQRLRDQDPKVMPALMWLEGCLAAQGTTVDEIVRDEHQRQGATNVTTRNIITSMHLGSVLSAMTRSDSKLADGGFDGALRFDGW
jgi:cyclic beta-1,2-glucan glucanotransferase